MKIAVAQLDPVVGDFDGNVGKIAEAYRRACGEKARFLVTPELSVCGYPPLDLVERPEFFDRCETALQKLETLTQGQSTALLVGCVVRNPSDTGKPARNTVFVLEGGKRVYSQAKSLLPTYDVFDEARYFEPADAHGIWVCDGRKVGIAVCEDLWADKPHADGRHLYRTNIAQILQSQGAELVCSLSASPYEWEKLEERERLHREVSEAVGLPLLYVNQVGATDEILFDGGSFGVTRGSGGAVLAGRLPFFKTAFGCLDWKGSELTWLSPDESDREDRAPASIELLARGLTLGIRDYFQRTGFKTAILGLSGGIDSAVVATLAARALGPTQVLGIAMPSQYSSAHSLEDAEVLAKNLGIAFEVRPIKFAFSSLSRELTQHRGELSALALENLQARLRGLTLMTLSNHYNALVLTTGNKSEIAMGYCTLYGDMVGALAPIGDLFKTRVYELARYLNSGASEPIPPRTLTKAPSAELKPNQTDQDTLPPYEDLDPFLKRVIEDGLVADAKASPAWAADVMKRLNQSEYKRRQAAPALKISPKSFGLGRRIPIAKTWR